MWPVLLTAIVVIVATGALRLSAAESVGDSPVAQGPATSVSPTTTLSPATTVSPTTTTTAAPTTTVPINPACLTVPDFSSVEGAAPTVGTPSELAQRIEEALAHPGFADVELSLSAWSEDLGEFATHQPDLQLEPASNQKLLVAFAANDAFAPDGRLQTVFEKVGSDLVIRASADPAISLARLTTALDAVATIETSFDSLVIDVSPFPQGPRAAGWFDWQIPQYVGPLSGFMIDNNRWTQSSEMVASPNEVNGERVIQLLGDRGVAVGDLVIAEVAPPPGDVLATIDSPTVDQLVRTMMLASDNQHADLLLMELGRDAAGDGNLVAGANAIDAVLDGRCLDTEGVIDDGSGLSRDNRRSARSFVEMLASIHGTPEGELLRSQLPVGGVSGTLSRRFSGAYGGRVFAKTGTIIGGRSLTGWATTTTGDDVIFSILVNGEPEAAHASLGAIDALVRTLVDS